MTNIPGLYASGEVDYQYHGANRLGANSLISCIFAGFVGGPAMVRYVREAKGREPSTAALEQTRRREEEYYQKTLAMAGDENPYKIHEELGRWMNENVTVVRYNHKLEATDQKLQELTERWRRINVQDTNRWTNQPAVFIRHLWHMLQLGRVVTQGALRRNESRGAHYKPDFPQRNDQEWLKTTIARFSESGPVFDYQPVDTSMVKLRERKYT
jgi:succinate dehydrogenase / fumarate reductase, flavoprotein subunit